MIIGYGVAKEHPVQLVVVVVRQQVQVREVQSLKQIYTAQSS